MHNDLARNGVQPTVDRMQLSGPSEIIQMVPFLLGFEPSQSLVLVGLAPPRHRVKVTARVDIDVPVGELDSWFAAARESEADSFVIAIYDDESIDQGLWDPTEPNAALPRRAIADALEAEGLRHGMDLLDALLVSDGRWWSYICASDQCCPPEGTPLVHDGPIAVEAVSYGMVAAPERESLVRELETDVCQMLDVEAALGAMSDREFNRWAILPGRASVRTHRRRAVEFVEHALDDFRLTGALPDPLEVAKLLLCLRDIHVRDSIIASAQMSRDSQDRSFWRSLCSAAPHLLIAPPATLYALCSYACGDGARANVGVDRALGDEPHYRLAELIGQAVGGGVAPSLAVSSILEGARRERAQLFRKSNRSQK